MEGSAQCLQLAVQRGEAAGEAGGVLRVSLLAVLVPRVREAQHLRARQGAAQESRQKDVLTIGDAVLPGGFIPPHWAAASAIVASAFSVTTFASLVTQLASLLQDVACD